MAFTPFALNLWVQLDKTKWKDMDMDSVLDRDAEMRRLEAHGDWCEALYEGAAPYPLVVTRDGLEGAEGLPSGFAVELEYPRVFDAHDKQEVAAPKLTIDGKLITQRPALVEGGIVWATPKRQEAHKALVPPIENIQSGYTCSDCKRWSHSDGQRWLNEVTHPFKGEGQSKQMWHDVIGMIGSNTNIQMPDSPDLWGACLEHNRLVERTFPGCESFVKRVVWKKG